MATRIALIFGLWAVALALIYTLLVVAFAQLAEDRLMRELLDEESRNFAQAMSVDDRSWEPSSHFIRSGEIDGKLEITPPEGFDPSISGIQDLTGDDGRQYQAISLEPGDSENTRFLILDREAANAVASGVDEYLNYLALVGLGVMLFTAGISFVVGHGAAKPVAALSNLVRGKSLNNLPDHFAHEFGHGEVRDLADVLETSLANTRDALNRERIFNHGISHELRSSLQSAEHALELIQNKSGEVIDSTVLARLDRSLKAMHGASEAFLWLSRPDLDKADSEPVDTYEIASTVIARFEAIAKARGVIIGLEASSDVNFFGPEAVIDVLISNLLRNAIQHADGGKVEISLSNDQIEIIDNGRGMTDKQISILNLGDVLDDSAGNGIGLVLCRRLCDRFGWSLAFESDGLGQGMTARVSPL